MNIVIMGGGRVGLNLSSFLVSDGHDITLIENNEDKCHEIASQLDATVVCGSGADINILEECDVEDADVFVAATGNDESNLLACILVKDMDVPKVISRVTDPNHKEAFCNVGIDTVINPELTAASYVEKLIIQPKVSDLAVLGKGDAELLDFTLETCDFIGKRIGDVSPTDDYIIVAIYSDGNVDVKQLTKFNSKKEIIKHIKKIDFTAPSFMWMIYKLGIFTKKDFDEFCPDGIKNDSKKYVDETIKRYNLKKTI